MKQVDFPIEPLEPLVYFASRYARSRGVMLHNFTRHMAMDLRNSAKFAEAAAILSRFTGNERATLEQHAMIRTTTNSQLFGESLMAPQLERACPRFCPVCVAADIESRPGRASSRPFVRASWLIKSIVACPIHDMTLVSLPCTYQAYRCTDFSNALHDNWSLVLRHIENPERQATSDFDRYFTGRFTRSHVANDILDPLSYTNAISFCQSLGSMKFAASTKDRRTKLLPEEVSAGCRHGFRRLAGGSSDFRSFLEEAVSRRGSMTTGFGELLRHLSAHRDHPGYQAITDLVREVGFSRTSVRHILGAARPDGYTVRSAADKFDITPLTAKKLFATSVRENGPTIDAAVAADLSSKWNDRIGRLPASRMLNIDVYVLDDIERAGLVKRHAVGELGYRFYLKSELFGFLADIKSHAKHPLPDPELRPFSAKFGLRFAYVLLGVVAGTFRAAVEPGHDDFQLAHLLVHTSDLRAAKFVKPEGTQFTGYVQTQYKLSANSVRNLRELKVIESAVAIGNDGIERVLFSEGSLEDFNRCFVSLKYLVRNMHRLPRVEQRLAGISPAFDFGGIDRIYRRSDLPKKNRR